MPDPQRLSRLLVKALALGDLEIVEHCALALVTGDEQVHADYEGTELVECERHLLAFLYALPPFHRNPCRSQFVDARTREQRLVGCFVEISPKGATPELTTSIRGTILEDRGDVWVVRLRQRSAVGEHTVEVAIVVPLDSIAACDVRPNEAQYRVHGLEPATTPDKDLLARYLGQSPWPWFERLAPRAVP